MIISDFLVIIIVDYNRKSTSVRSENDDEFYDDRRNAELNVWNDIQIELNDTKYLNNIESTYNIPIILKCCNMELYGESLWCFCVDRLETKDRDSLWIILNYIASKMSTSIIINLLESYHDNLCRLNINRLNELCLTIIKYSKFNIHTSLYLCGYIKKSRLKQDKSRENEFKKN